MNTAAVANQREVPVPPTLGTDGIEPAIIAYILRAGTQAPSVYNTQPWRLAASAQGIDLYLDDQADDSLYDWHNLNSTLACGAAAENMIIAAQGRGLTAGIEQYPDPSHPLLVAQLMLTRGTTDATVADKWGHPLEEAIWHRHTNTLMYDERPADDITLQSLQESVAAFPGSRIHWAITPEERHRVFTAVATAEQVRFARQDLHEQLHRMIRWNDAEAQANPTGYTLPSMGACGIGEAFFRVTRRWPVMRLMNRFGAFKDQAKRANLGLQHCAAVGLLTLDVRDERNWLDGGRALERLWLTATGLGLDLQPHSTITLFDWIWRGGEREIFGEEHRAILSEAWLQYQQAFPDAGLAAAETRGVFLFRVGRGERVKGYTLRRSPLL